MKSGADGVTANTVRATVVPVTADERRRAKYRKYAKSAKGKARARRYNASAKGKVQARRKDARCNRRRLWVGKAYAGRAKTVEDAAVITRHIKGRLHAFITRQQARAQAEGF